MYNNVTLVLTSCGRLDLLEQTINFIPKEILKRIPKKIIIDDSVNLETYNTLKNSEYLSDWVRVFNEEKLGQAASIHKAYSLVQTDYVFHCEDDWGFDDFDFVKPSLDILEKYDNLVQVTFRKDSPHPTHEDVYEENERAFRVLIPGYNGWPGFTYNPNIFRFSAYKQLGSCVGMTEKQVGEYYKNAELYTAALERRVVYHLGDGRHVYDSISGV
jgi:hypothetical protein